MNARSRSGAGPAARPSAHAPYPSPHARRSYPDLSPTAPRPDLIAVPAASWPAWTDLARWTLATEGGGHVSG